MTFKQAKKEYQDYLKEYLNVMTWEEVKARMSKTDIRCGWVDYVDYLVRDKRASEKIAYKWGQVI